MRSSALVLLLASGAAAFHAPPRALPRRAAAVTMQIAPQGAATAAAFAAAYGAASSAHAARSGGRAGGRVSGGGRSGGGYRGGGGGGAVRNVYVAPPPLFSPFGFGFSPFGFSPFGFGFGFGLPTPLLLLAIAGLAATSFRSSRGIDGGGYDPIGASDEAGAALCLQVACYCDNRQDSLYGRLNQIASRADTDTAEGLQGLCSDTCLAILRSSKDWLAGRTKSSTAGLFGGNDVESDFNRLVVQERAKWETERRALTRTAPGQPTYMVATLVVLLREGKSLPDVTGVSDLRDAIQSLAAEVANADNLIAAEVLWTPEEENDVMDRDELFLNFPELVNV